MSAMPPSSIEPRSGRRIALAGLTVLRSITCSSVRPMARNFDMTFVIVARGSMMLLFVNVGRDRVGQESLLDRGHGDAEPKAAGTVADVEQHASLARLPHVACTFFCASSCGVSRP